MAIPDFQSLMFPMLNHISDGVEHTTIEVYDSIANQLNLTEEELNEYLPSGNQKIFYNRLFWAKAHLKMAGLIENTKRGHFKITDLGKDFLKKKPKEINISVLKQFPDYLVNAGRVKEDTTVVENASKTTTPEEDIEISYLRIRKNLSSELLFRVKQCTPQFFEKLVVELLVKMGYGGSIQEAGKTVGRVGDEGIDGIIKEDKLGLDVIYIQAKRWENVVGRPEIQKFVGALAGQGAKKGVFITTSIFTNEAREYQPKNETKIVLIDGEQLADLMIDYDLGVSLQNLYLVKRIDIDYFEND